MNKAVSVLLLAVAAWLLPGAVIAQSTAEIEGIWEGPWYRGMTSGRAHLEVNDGGATLQLTNAETFGEAAQRLTRLSVKGRSVSLRAVGDSGAALTVDLTLNQEGDQMKGMGKYEGLSVRLELRRAAN